MNFMTGKLMRSDDKYGLMDGRLFTTLYQLNRLFIVELYELVIAFGEI
jgi:hypothetical protein